MNDEQQFKLDKIWHELAQMPDGESQEELTIEDIETTLIAYVEATSPAPKPELKETILNKIRTLQSFEKSQGLLDLNNPPLLTAHSNWAEWEAATRHIQPPDDFENLFMELLYEGEGRLQFLVIVKDLVPEEVHHEFHESFLLLEGCCECHITDEKGNKRIERMSAGDYLKFEIGEHHEIRITSGEYGRGILQWSLEAA